MNSRGAGAVTLARRGGEVEGCPDADLGPPAPSRRAGVCRTRLGAPRRELEDEARVLRRTRDAAEAPSMEARDVPRQRQAEAVAVPRLPGLRAPIEALEELLAVRDGDARARARDRQAHARGVGIQADPARDVPRSELPRVVEKVLDRDAQE